MSTIRVVLVDAGNVFVAFMDRAEVFARIARVANAPVIPTIDDLARQGLFSQEHDGTPEGPYHHMDTGKISHRGIYLKFLQATGLGAPQLPERRFWSLYCRNLNPIPGVAAILEELHAAGIPLIVVSNGELGSQHAADVISFHYAVRWTGVVISADVQVKKPGRAMFYAAVAIARRAVPDLREQEVVFIDDNPRYCTGFGALFPYAYTVVFNGSAQSADDLRRALHNLGLPIRPPGHSSFD